MQALVEARGVSKTIVCRTVLENIQFEIAAGECFGLVGPSGSGKTTLVNLISSIWQPTTGEIFVFGLNSRTNAKAIKGKIGVVPQDDRLVEELTVLDNLVVFAGYFGIPTGKAALLARDLLRGVQIEDIEDRVVSSLGVFQRRRLALARGLIAQPQLLIVDQPSQGLNAQERAWLWEWLKRKKQQGMAIILSTPSFDEAEYLCDRLIFLKNGRILLLGSPQPLIHEHVGRAVVEYRISPVDLEYHLNHLRGRYQYQVLGDKIRIFLSEPSAGVEAAKAVTSERIEIRPASLEDVLNKVVGHELRGSP